MVQMRLKRSMPGVKVANDVTGTVRDAVIAYSQGKVSFADGANVEGSW